MSHYPNDTWRWGVTAQLGLMVPLAILALGTFLALSGISAVRQIPVPELVVTEWLPMRGHFGLVLLFVGTAASTILALTLAIPIGLSAALYLALYATPTVRSLADASIALLGGMPSVVIGLWAMTWIVPVAGNSLFAASAGAGAHDYPDLHPPGRGLSAPVTGRFGRGGSSARG